MSNTLIPRRRVVGLAGGVVAAFAIATSVAAPAGAASTVAVSCTTAAPVLQLANPNPGDVISQGDYIVSGMAFDPSADGGNGISHVDLFLGDRDSGGLFLVSVTPDGGANGRIFETKATLPSSASGGRNLVAYAYSAVTGESTSVSVPVFIGAAPTPTPSSSTAPTPVPLTSTTTSNCSGTVAPAAPATGSTAAFQPLPVATFRLPPVLQLANPGSGDVLGTGDVIIEGVAYDPSTSQGDGVDRVDLFLDNRDTGGLPVGSGVPGANHTFSIKAKLPASSNGGHEFFAYAHSSVTDQESVTSVPVFVGAAPTPTPRPKPNS